MHIRPATKVTIIYLLFGFTWILLSDKILLFLSSDSVETIITLQRYKGLFYVLFTGYFLYVLMRTFYRGRDERLEQLEQQDVRLNVIRRITKTANWDFDPVSRVLSVSEETAAIFDYPENILQPQAEFLFEFIKYPEDAAKLKSLHEKALCGSAYDMEIELITKQGTDKWIRLVGTPVMKHGQCVRLYGIYQDITNSRKAQQQISQLSRLKNFITSVNKAIVRTHVKESLLEQVCEAAVERGQFKMAWVGKCNAEVGQPQTVHTAVPDGFPKPGHDGFEPGAMEIKMLQQIRQANQREAVVINNVNSESADVHDRERLLKMGFKSFIVLPLFIFEEMYGALLLYSPIPDFFDAAELELLQDAAADITNALESFEHEQQQLATQQKLEESEERYRLIVQTASEGMILLDEKFCVRFANSNFSKMLGLNEQNLVGLCITDLLKQEDVERFHQQLLTSADGENMGADYYFSTENGGHLWAQISVTALKKNGQYNGALAMITDVTSRKKAEDAMKNALERYDIVTRATKDTIWDWNIAEDTITYNQGIENVFGYVRSALDPAFSWKKVKVHRSSAASVQRAFEDAFTAGAKSLQVQYRFLCANGQYKNVSDKAFIQYDNSGKPLRVIGTMQDITKESELEMRIQKAVIGVQEQERQQIGMELHDNVNQLLAASLLFIGLVKDGLKKNNDPTALFISIEKYIREAIDEVRQLSHRLAPVSFKDLTIQSVFNNLLETMNAEKLFNVTLSVDAHISGTLPVDVKMNLYRIAQEQLNNIIKHAHATEVRMCLQKEDGMLRFSIRDNGRGFDPRQSSKGIGLENIRRRTQIFAGNFNLVTAPGKGCEVVVEIPNPV